MAGRDAPYPSWEGAEHLAALRVDGDLVFLSNAVLDQAVLAVAARLGGRRPFTWRTATAATLGGVYAVAILYPALLPAAGLAGKIALSLFMLVVAFGCTPRRSLGRLLVAFYAAAFGLAGLAYGIQALTASPLGDVGGLVATAIALPVAWFGAGWLARSLDARARRGGVLPVTIRVGEREVNLTGLVDTGNRARDPISRAPIVFCDLRALAALMPPDVLAAFSGEAATLFDRLPGDLDPAWASRLRLVPVASVAGLGHMVVGFRPDAVFVGAGAETAATALVGVSPEALSHDGSFQVLIPAALAPAAPVTAPAGLAVPLPKGGLPS